MHDFPKTKLPVRARTDLRGRIHLMNMRNLFFNVFASAFIVFMESLSTKLDPESLTMFCSGQRMRQ